MLPRVTLAVLIALAGAALASDYLSADGGGFVQARHGDGASDPTGTAAPATAADLVTPPGAANPVKSPSSSPAPAAASIEKPRFCGFAPCGMPLDCPDPD